jgi:hypothetical protein
MGIYQWIDNDYHPNMIFFFVFTQVRLKQFKKTNANYYQPGSYDFKQNLCEILSYNSSAYTFFKMFVDNVQPGLAATYQNLFHPCPVQVHEKKIIFSFRKFWLTDCLQDVWTADLLQDDNEAGSFSFMIPPGQYRTMIRIYSELNQTFYELNTYYLFK